MAAFNMSLYITKTENSAYMWQNNEYYFKTTLLYYFATSITFYACGNQLCNKEMQCVPVH